MRATRFAWLSGLFAVWLLGCGTPCENTAQCGEDGMCVAALCQPLRCEKTLFAVDPKSGECVPLSGCFLTAEQRGWHTCSDDPCRDRDESSCLADARCQPVYANPNVLPRVRSGGDSSAPAAGIPCLRSDSGGPGEIGKESGFAPGVNNGESPKRDSDESGCDAVDRSARAFVTCRAVPSLPTQKRCELLSSSECAARRDCATSLAGLSDGQVTVPVPSDGRSASDFSGERESGQCFTRHAPPSDFCLGADARSCLLSRACQPIGGRCYCPPGARCDCEGGEFLGCETNDHLRRCTSSAECGAGERCDNDEACSQPRTFASQPPSGLQPGAPGCVGACVPKGCAGLGERLCNESPECDGGSYGTVCRPKPYCVSTPPEQDRSGAGSGCGCDARFIACRDQMPSAALRSERSLLVRDPEIIDDPAFTIDAVLGKLAPAGRLDAFALSLLQQIGEGRLLSNNALARPRLGYAGFLSELRASTAELPGLAKRLAGQLHITALVNRIDLAKPGDCGEARLTYALSRAYTDGNQRLTLIIELRVPDDGSGCRTVAQRWAELSLIDSIAERRSRLLALYDELLKPAHLGQIRTNEFLNRTGQEPWELRELHLDGSGMPQLVPVAQTVDERWLSNSGFRAWLRDNDRALREGNAVIPSLYLAAASREDGGRLQLDDPTAKATEKQLNAQSCAGCHLTETQSPFVHIGERLGKKVPGQFGYRPLGRAVIDAFLQKELVTRAQHLRELVDGTAHSLQASPATGLARVH